MSRRVRAASAAPRGKARRARRAPWLRSWHAILITLGLLIAQGPVLAHLLIVRHVTCEHGELVEGAGHAARHETSLDSADDGSSGERAAPGGGAESDHDHCDALALRHCPTAVGVVIGPATLIEIARLTALGEGLEQRPVPLLSLAPKSSPPAISCHA